VQALIFWVMLLGIVPWLLVISARTIVREGRGTPLPSAATNDLVTSGPFRIVRNPMAIAGLVQGFAVALALASGVVAVYVLLGGVVWHLVVRPLEEHDLHDRFGAAYDTYRHRVRCCIASAGEFHRGLLPEFRFVNYLSDLML